MVENDEIVRDTGSLCNEETDNEKNDEVALNSTQEVDNRSKLAKQYHITEKQEKFVKNYLAN